MVASRVKQLIKGAIPDRFMLHRLPRHYSNSILLTFDDGPDPSLTEQVLKRLKHYNAKAVFFVVGKKADQYPHLVKAIHDDGHLVGLHSYNHPNRVIKSSLEYRHEMDLCQTTVTRITGEKSRLVRPPLGMSPACLWTAVRMKKLTVMWSIESGEWGVYRDQSADDMGRRLVRELRARDIVLMHDNNVKILTVLDYVLPSLVSQGIELDTFGGA